MWMRGEMGCRAPRRKWSLPKMGQGIARRKGSAGAAAAHAKSAVWIARAEERRSMGRRGSAAAADFGLAMDAVLGLGRIPKGDSHLAARRDIGGMEVHAI